MPTPYKAAPVRPFREKAKALTADLLFISESEAPLEILEWPEVNDIQHLPEAIARHFAIPASAQTELSTEAFLTPIHNMASPDDPAMQVISEGFDELFALLQSDGRTLIILRGGKNTVHYFIGSFGKEGSILLHTTAVET